MSEKTAGVLLMSRTDESSANSIDSRILGQVRGRVRGTDEDCRTELIDSAELAARWRVPASWIRNRTRSRTPREERIPCLRLGRYVRFEWGSVPLSEWLAKKRN